MLSKMHKLFEEMAQEIIKTYAMRIKNSLSNENRLLYIKNMKAELSALKEAYGVVYIPSNVDEHVFDINAAFAIN